MINLKTEIEKINYTGITIAKRLKKIGLNDIYDLLFYFPFRYDDFKKIPINLLEVNTNANIVGQIELIQNKRSPRKRINITEAIINDNTESIKVIWFNQPFIAKNLKSGDIISLSGKIENDYGGFIMRSPVYEKIINNNSIHTQGIIPNYHLTSNITQKQIRFLIKKIIYLAKEIEDWIPKNILKNLKLLSLEEAIKKIHFPKEQNDINKAKKRLAFDELFLTQLQSQKTKKEIEKNNSYPIKFLEKKTKGLVNSLPFKLTDAQKKSSWKILQNIKEKKPMSMLLEGDVGSGKTIVAIIAMFNVALNKKQTALMAPTEILANQHFNSITKILKNFDIKIGLITKNEKKINIKLESDEKKYTSNLIAENSDIIIGTHSLIQKDVNFKDLALVIVDEQHRFGVKQRKNIIEKAKTTPHFLSMTATPIPRSLALAIFGELDLSIIDEMPKGRKKVITSIISEEKRKKAYNFIKEEIKKDRQVFVVCPLIDISDKLGVKSVKEEYKKLNEEIFPDLKIDFLHGKMKADEKEKIMQNFLNNNTKILVSTSVVEVGVDIPNATIMMIEGADRFGLAQLHQFRGRVGRSEYQSYCFLFTSNEGEKTQKRLEALVNNNNGFSLAKMDLKFRGPGEVYGLAQKGFPEFKMASLFDYELIKQAQEEAKKIIETDPDLKNYPLLKNKLEEMNKIIHLE